MDPFADRDACDGKVNSTPRRHVNLSAGGTSKHEIVFSGSQNKSDTVDQYHKRLREKLLASLPAQD